MIVTLGSQKPNILVTGSAGYIGEQIVFLLKMKGYSVGEVDLIDGIDIKRLAIDSDGFDIVIHLAAKKQGEDVYEYNLETTRPILDIPKIVFASTIAVYGECKKPVKETDKLKPLSDYGKSKADCEKLIIDSGCKYSIFRMSNLYSLDDKDGIVGQFLQGDNKIFGDGTKKRDYLRVEEVIPIIVEAALTDKWLGIYNLSTGKTVTTTELHNRLSDEKPEYISRQTNEARCTCANNTKAKKKGFNPFIL